MLRALLGLLLLLLVDLFGGLGLGLASSGLDLGALSILLCLVLLPLILLSLFLSSNISFGVESGPQLHLLLLGCSLALCHSGSVLTLFLCLCCDGLLVLLLALLHGLLLRCSSFLLCFRLTILLLRQGCLVGISCFLRCYGCLFLGRRLLLISCDPVLGGRETLRGHTSTFLKH